MTSPLSVESITVLLKWITGTETVLQTFTFFTAHSGLSWYLYHYTIMLNGGRDQNSNDHISDEPEIIG